MYQQVCIRHGHSFVLESSVALFALSADLLEPLAANPQLLASNHALHAVALQLYELVSILLVHQQPILL